VGLGYDAHRLVEGRQLVLGGVVVPFEKGLLGHSDADVLLHAIMDAMLGAAALGDIGLHFPDSDDRFKGISSLLLLAETNRIIGRLSVSNLDATIVAQAPKLAPFIPQMIENIARTLVIPLNSVNIKATTEEYMGFTGDGTGIAAQAIVLLHKGASFENL